MSEEILLHVPISLVEIHNPEQLQEGRIRQLMDYQREHGHPPGPASLWFDPARVPPFTVDNGRHRITAARRLGRRTIVAWVRTQPESVAGLARHRRARWMW